jgi:hypothetical protein
MHGCTLLGINVVGSVRIVVRLLWKTAKRHAINLRQSQSQPSWHVDALQQLCKEYSVDLLCRLTPDTSRLQCLYFFWPPHRTLQKPQGPHLRRALQDRHLLHRALHHPHLQALKSARRHYRAQAHRLALRPVRHQAHHQAPAQVHLPVHHPLRHPHLAPAHRPGDHRVLSHHCCCCYCWQRCELFNRKLAADYSRPAAS